MDLSYFYIIDPMRLSVYNCQSKTKLQRNIHERTSTLGWHTTPSEIEVVLHITHYTCELEQWLAEKHAIHMHYTCEAHVLHKFFLSGLHTCWLMCSEEVMNVKSLNIVAMEFTRILLFLHGIFFQYFFFYFIRTSSISTSRACFLVEH